MNEQDKIKLKDHVDNGTPIFVFTAKDKLATEILYEYAKKCVGAECLPNHSIRVIKRGMEFDAWQKDNEEKVHLPN